MPNYLVTGGAGFIGSNVVESLVEKGESVRVLDNCSTGKLSNLEAVADRIEFVQGDIRDASIVRKAVAGMDYVMHHAAAISVIQSVQDPMTTNEMNISGTLNVLLAARDASVKRLIFAGSAAAYGNSKTIPKKEDMPVEPVSPYAISKCTGEQYCRIFYDLYGVETVVLRYFNVYGQKQRSDTQYASVIPIFARCFLEGRAPTIFGDGEQSRDFVFIDDIVQANLLACSAENAAGGIFNIAYGESFTINYLVEAIGEILESSIEPIHLEERNGDVKHSQADISRARRILGYEPKVDLKTGLEKTLEWFKAVEFAPAVGSTNRK